MKLIFPSGTEILVKEKVSMKLTNSLFYEESSFTYTFKIAATFAANKEFSFFNKYESKHQFSAIEKVILQAGIFEMYGTLYLKLANTEYYECFFVANDKISKLKNTFVDDTDGVFEIPFSNANIDTLHNPENYPYAFLPVYPHLTELNEDDNPKIYVENYPIPLDKYCINLYEETLTGHFNIPFIKYSYIIELMLNNCGISIETNLFATENDLSKLYHINNCALEKFSITAHSNTHLWVNKIENNLIYFWVDLTNINLFKFDFNNPDKEYILYFDIHESVTKLSKFRNKYYSVKITWGENISSPSTASVSNVELPDCTPEELNFIEQVGTYFMINACSITDTYLNTIKIKNHLPHISVSDFIKEIEKYFFVKFIFSENGSVCNIVKLKDIINSPKTIDVSDICLLSSKQGIEQTIEGYKIGFEKDGNDKFLEFLKDDPENVRVLSPVADEASLPLTNVENNDFCFVAQNNFNYLFTEQLFFYRPAANIAGSWAQYSFHFPFYKFGASDVEYISKICPLMCTVRFTDYPNNLLEAVMNKPIGCYNFSDNIDKEALRVVFYRGYRNFSVDGITVSAPCVTNSVYDGEGKIEDANLSLDYTSDYSITNVLAKDWLTWYHQNRRDDKVKLYWPVSVLNEPQMSVKRSINGNDFFIKSISFDINPDDSITMGETEISLL
jgi:hypothetical protein